MRWEDSKIESLRLVNSAPPFNKGDYYLNLLVPLVKGGKAQRAKGDLYFYFIDSNIMLSAEISAGFTPLIRLA